MSSCRLSPVARHRRNYCAFFTTAISAPLIGTKLAINWVANLIDINKIFEESQKINIIIKNVSAEINLNPDYPDDIIKATLTRLSLKMSSLADTEIPPYLLNLHEEIANSCKTAAWVVGGSIAILSAGYVGYKWRYSQPAATPIPTIINVETPLLNVRVNNSSEDNKETSSRSLCR